MIAALSRFTFFALMLSVLGACATAPVVSQPTRRYFWPPEPEQPRIEWIAAYYGDADIKESTLMTSIVGVDSNLQFGRPVFVAGDGEGRFVVSDQEAGGAFMFDLNSRQATRLGGDTDGANFTQPTGVAVDGDGNFYVADTSARKVFVVNGENKMLRVIDLTAHVKSIGNLTVDRSRARLLVPDAKGSKVCAFTLTGQLLTTFEGKGYFSYPNAVAVTSDGNLLIADTFNATIVRFSAEGKFLNAIGKRGDSPGDLTLVTGVAVDSEDNVYATDGRLSNVSIFDKQGNALMVIGGHHSIRSGNVGRGGFQIPQGISIDKNDRIYVADSLNRRIQVLQYLSERYLREHPVVAPKPLTP